MIQRGSWVCFASAFFDGVGVKYSLVVTVSKACGVVGYSVVHFISAQY